MKCVSATCDIIKATSFSEVLIWEQSSIPEDQFNCPALRRLRLYIEG